MRASLKLALVALLAVTATASTARAQSLRRFAIVAGNDTGGGDTRSLLYAGADARKVYDILTRLGGVRQEDATLLIGASASQLLGAIVAVEMQAAEAKQRGERTALFFYYSATRRTDRLRLGETPHPDRRHQGAHRRVADRRAHRDPRLVQVGAMTGAGGDAHEGARRAPAFEIQADGPRDAKGVVILTSSTSDEDSQESDAIGGSYFSHHLASGPARRRGQVGRRPRDAVRGLRLRLRPHRRRHRRERRGAQHPTFSYYLAGNGDLVLTDVAVRHEGVYLPREAPGGVYFLVDGKGFVAAEISKTDGVDRRVALSPGHYRVKRRLPDRLRVGDVDVPRGQMVAISEAHLRDAPFSTIRSRARTAST
jgi:hypothetical protein